LNQRKPLVSVIIITYNQENYISQCIESILNQKTNFDFEIVIGEDASTDNTKRIIENYALTYPDIIFPYYHKKNLGLLRNYFQTIEKCSGKYIAQCAGDDYWIDPQKIQIQVEFLEKNPKYQMIVTNHAVYFQNKKKLVKNYSSRIYKKSTNYDYDYDNFILDRSSIGTCTVMFTKTSVNEYLFSLGNKV
jgi:glycosyltransferase involved in cell wall biosynthesis